MLLLNLWDSFYALLIEPFTQYTFLRRAFIACCALSIGCGPIGTFMVLRRMSLVGDALSHGLLPGIAIAFLISGFSIIGLSIGGVIAGLCMALAANWIEAKTPLSKDSTFAAFFLISMAFGLLILAIFGNHLDLMHVLLGTILSLSKESLTWISVVSSLSLLLLTLIYRPLVLRSFDPAFFQSLGGRTSLIDFLFLTLVTVNLVSAFQALGTLMALGLLLLPAITARLFARQIWTLALSATLLGMASSYCGLLIAYHGSCPSGPAIVLMGGIFYILALLAKLWSKGQIFGRITLFLCLLGGGLSLATLSPKNPFSDTRPHIVVSFTVLADFIHVLGGENFRVTSLVGPNGDAHTYEPSPADMIALRKADFVVINGLGLEGHWMQRLLEEPDFKGRILIATQGCQPRFLLMGSQKIPDPHAWQDARNARIYIRNLHQCLRKLFPSCASCLDCRAKVYDQKLTTLDQWIRFQINRVPQTQRQVLTTHDGFGYFGQAYGVLFRAPWGLSTDVEPSPQVLRNLLQAIRQQEITVLFLENMMNPQLMNEIAKETNIHIGGTLYSDALSEADGPAATYLHMMRHNTTTLVQGMLQGRSSGALLNP